MAMENSRRMKSSHSSVGVVEAVVKEVLVVIRPVVVLREVSHKAVQMGVEP